MIRKREAEELEQLEQNTEMYWRSLGERSGQAEFSAEQDFEYTPSEEELQSVGLNRRKFVGLMGASMALTGLAATGCIRKPVEQIMPYNQRPEEITPGNPIHFATATHLGRAVLGLVVESQEGRPTKIEGNPDHPMSLGATDVWAQASVLNLYDPDRSKKPAHAGRETSWEEFFQALGEALKDARASQGDGLALLIEETPSPSFHALLDEFKKKFPQSRVFLHDLASTPNQGGGLSLVGCDSQHPLYRLERAKRVLSVGNDFLGKDGDSVFHAKQFSKGRDIAALEDHGSLSQKDAADRLNRLYVAEANFTNTGVAADHRLRVRASEQTEFLAAVAGRLLELGLNIPSGSQALAKRLKERYDAFQKINTVRNQEWDRWIQAVAKDLKAHAGASVVLVGEHLSAKAHALGHFINALLGNIGADKPVLFYSNANETDTENLQALAGAIRAGSVQTLVMLGGNPVYTAPSDLQFEGVLDAVQFSVHLSTHMDETSQLATWHVPQNHFLESWGDLRSTDGSVSIQQPLISPMHGTISSLELLAHVVGEQPIKGHDLVRNYWKQQIKGISFDRKWRRWLHEGVISGTAAAHEAPKFRWDGTLKEWSNEPEKHAAKGFELLFTTDGSVFDGRFSNNAWLQEMPDPITKLTWDNAALINVQTAQQFKLDNGEWISVSLQGKTLNLPVYILPGLAENTIVLPLGYGRTFNGRVSKGAGFNVFPLRTSAHEHFVTGAAVKKINQRRYKLVSTQEHGRSEESFAGFGSLTEPTIMGRKGKVRATILRQSSLAEYQEDPKRFEKMEPIAAKNLKSLWKEPNEQIGQQWGMAIDLTRCNGCSACVLACQSENNISVVGKERVGIGREMHWIRIDRYFHNDPQFGEPALIDDVEVSTQPMACAHCENAPCESVCPVAATTHSPDGLNDMAYNRCIGTRYCSNNCPYKVRRFNFFNYSKENDALLPALQMQRNPDVTVRFRGVMEKCTYCVQRINTAKVHAKAKGDGFIKDGNVTTACEQVCPADAIVFGDVRDPNSRVAKLKKRDRDYGVLAELNNRPRTSYLARIRNRNPELQVSRSNKRKG